MSARRLCHEMQFDASQSSDPDGGALSYTWRFDTGNGPLEGAKTRIRFDETGDHSGRLEVFDDSGRVRFRSRQRIQLLRQTTPRLLESAHRHWLPSIRRFGSMELAPQRCHALPGTGLTRYHWRLGDGTEIVQRPEDAEFGVPVHRYTAPGLYTIELTVTRRRGQSLQRRYHGPIQSASMRRPWPMPAATRGWPMAKILQLDAGETTGADGDPHSFHWAFGDGNTATGASVEHQYAKAGT